MDISIAVSLIRGQMGTVVEQAVNGAVETVLAEMLKVVGAKFEELKGQVAHMKRDITSLQREKALKEKENENIRAKLRYTELKLKYYRQGVEEELQQRASASGLVRIHPSSVLPAQRGCAGVSSIEITPPCSAPNRTSEGSGMKTNQECTSPHNNKRQHGVRVRCHPDVPGSELSELLPPASPSENTGAECVDSSTGLFCPMEQEAAQSQEDSQGEDCQWTIALEPQTETVDTVSDPLHVQTLTLDLGHQTSPVSLSPEGSTLADSSTVPSSAPQVKQEPQPQEQEEEVICIKEEPEEEQVTAALLMDCQVQQSLPLETEAQSSVTDWPELQENKRKHTTAFSATGTNTYIMPQPSPSLPSMVASQQTNPPHQVQQPWPNDLSLYEEYKLRRNELRRMNLSRRRELEKMLPQPLLADLVRERREKTRLRVARWRAKRKLQAGLNQIQAEGGAAGFSSSGFAMGSQRQQQLRGPCAASSSSSSSGGAQQRQSSSMSPSISFLNNNISVLLPFIPASSSSSSSSSSSLHLSHPSMAHHQHTVPLSSSSSPSQVSLSAQHGLSLDSDIIQCRV
ncbi:uncharacterized protein LOC141808498 isoform X2 [Halichoeres trimaculatus]|uniref:uncharacterized protein LOC141808498 isoform X2 n=1 Tax=Halichoeres trimaculatus TaxID=147232 RepID=UPI003D9E7DDA